MEKYPANSDGERHYEKVKKNIPSPYCNYVEDIKYVRGGRVYERILKRILEETLPGSKIDKSSAVFPMERGKINGGYLQPDLRVNDHVFIEVTTWGDSNMIFSKIMQGYLLKKEISKGKILCCDC